LYCSPECRRKGLTIALREYVAKNRTHVRDHASEREKRIWGVSNSSIADRAEKFAKQKLLPMLGFTKLCHASTINHFFPFDFVAAYKTRRVLVDVTTGVSKELTRTGQNSLAEALRMPIFVLFVKPDFSKYQLTQANSSKTIQMHVSGLSAIE
jgi:hypothetical protein